jgi:hypothetical protein
MEKYIFVISLVLLLCSCSNGNTDNADVNTKESSWPTAAENVNPDSYGYIVDSEVMGLRYKSGEHFGVTDLNGKFGYIEGQNIQFYVGDISLGGKVEPLSRLTPYDLAEGNTDIAISITQFLQTLDDDALPSNGISINETVHLLAEQVELDLASSGWTDNPIAVDRDIENVMFELTSATETGSRYLVSRYSAYLHFAETLDAIIDELESNTVEVVEQTSCETAEQCVIVELRPKYSGYCPSPGRMLIYSQLDINLGSFNSSVNERSSLIDVREELEDSVVETYPITGVCLINRAIPFEVCNDQQRCEIQYY